MNALLAKLRGGDRRSIGRSAIVVRAILKDPRRFPDLVAGLNDENPLVRMRAADAIEKVTRQRPELLKPWKRVLLDTASTRTEKEMRWHAAQILPRLSLSGSELKAAVRLMEEYLKDESSIVKTCSMQALAELAFRDRRILTRVRPLIARLTRTGTPAMRSRGRKLLGWLDATRAARAR